MEQRRAGEQGSLGPEKPLSRPGDGWSFVTIAGTLDSGAGGPAPLSPPAHRALVDPTSGSEGRVPTDKWIVSFSGSLDQREPR